MKVYVGAVFLGIVVFGISFVFLLNKNQAQDSVTQQSVLAAETQEPCAILALEPGKLLAAEINYLVSTSGINDYGMVRMMIDEALTGIDPTKPIGVLVYVNEDFGEEPTLLACLPIGDLESMKQSLENFGSFNETAAGTQLKLHDGDLLKITETKGYLFVSNDRDAFEHLPKDPNELFAPMVQEHAIAFKFFGQRVPDSIKKIVWSGFKEDAEKTRIPGQSLDQMLIRTKGLIYDTDQVSLGLKIDQENRCLVLDTQLKGVEDSWMAERARKNQLMESSRFSGFRYKTSLMSLNFCNNDWSEDLLEFKANVRNVIEMAALQVGESDLINETMGGVFTIVDDTIKSGRTDFGVTTVVRKGKPVVAMGVHLVDTAPIRDGIESALEAINKNNAPTEYRQIESDFEGIEFYEFVGENTLIPRMQSLYGDKLKVTIGIGDQALYVGVGNPGYKLLKRCITDSQTVPVDHPTFFGEFRLKPVLSLIEPGNPLLGIFGPMIQQAEGADRIVVETRPIEAGFMATTKVEVGFIRALSQAADAIQKVGATSEAGFSRISQELDR